MLASLTKSLLLNLFTRSGHPWGLPALGSATVAVRRFR
jgi:hypothetical protein